MIVAGSAAAAADLDFEAGHSIGGRLAALSHQRSCRKSTAPRASSSRTVRLEALRDSRHMLCRMSELKTDPLAMRRFPKGRCFIPASHFFDFTGTKPPKSKWKFTKTGEDWFCFAGLWRPMPDGAADAFTILTTEPGADVTPIHNRQVVVVERADWLAWLDLTKPEPELLRPLPAGSLTVEQVR